MKNQIIDILNNQLNINVSRSLPINNPHDCLVIKDENIRMSILADMEENIGSHILKLSLPIEKYSRYKNNTVSSIIRAENGAIKEHIGHQAIKIADIVDSIFYKVSQYYTERVFQEFHEFFNHVQSVIYATEKNIINAIDYNFHREYLNELSSITEFFNEMYEDIGEISASRDRCNAYLNHVIGNRQKVLKLINHFLDKLSFWTSYILQWNHYTNTYNHIDYNNLANDYLICRQAISNYAICLVFEYILSGNIDNESKDKIIKKIQRVMQKFRDVDNAIKNSLNQRNMSNWQNHWYWHYENQFKWNDRNGINWFINECAKNDDFEIEEVKKIFSKSKLLLENIIIE